MTDKAQTSKLVLLPSALEVSAMNELRETAEIAVADADAILRGVVSTIDLLEDELSKDSKYYALLACLNTAIAKLETAAIAIDEMR